MRLQAHRSRGRFPRDETVHFASYQAYRARYQCNHPYRRDIRPLELSVGQR